MNSSENLKLPILGVCDVHSGEHRKDRDVFAQPMKCVNWTCCHKDCDRDGNCKSCGVKARIHMAKNPKPAAQESESRIVRVADLRAAIDEVVRMPHIFPCPTRSTCHAEVVSSECTCYKATRLAELRAQLAELTGQAEEGQ